MKYYINYTNEGKIIGFLKGDNGLNIEVSNSKWIEGQSYNKIIVKDKNITFEKVDWRTPEEIEEVRIISINNKVEEIIIKPYPIYKQLNIDNLLNPYTIEMRENKNIFIETVRNIGRIAKEDGTKPEDINWAGLDEITEPYQITQDLILQAKNLLGE